MKTVETADTLAAFPEYLLGNYGLPSIAIERAEGSYVYTEEGRQLLDFGSGIAVSAIGHCHPHWVSAIQEQAAQLGHISNLYAHRGQVKLAERLVGYAGGSGKIYFCNSGAEANEMLLKLARLHGRRKAGAEAQCYKVIGAENAFHGRTFGGMAVTPQEKIQGGFRPMLDGFAFGKLNDLQSFRDLIDERTAAIFIETIQGEGGIYPAETDFLRGLRALCDEHDLLLLLDEVQCGAGRTGNFFAFENAGVKPDAIGMAKGLGGGFPIGAVWLGDGHAELFQAGSHGTTYGGGPLACAAANAVLDVIERDGLLAKVQELSAVWMAELETLERSFPTLLDHLRGRGYMIGLALKIDPKTVAKKALERGLLAVPAGGNALRLLPPLTATESELQTATGILYDVFNELAT